MQSWTNLPTHGKRLNRIIRLLEKKLKQTDDDDFIIRYSNSIGVQTEKLINIAKLHLGIKDALDQAEIYTK